MFLFICVYVHFSNVWLGQCSEIIVVLSVYCVFKEEWWRWHTTWFCWSFSCIYEGNLLYVEKKKSCFSIHFLCTDRLFFFIIWWCSSLALSYSVSFLGVLTLDFRNILGCFFCVSFLMFVFKEIVMLINIFMVNGDVACMFILHVIKNNNVWATEIW